MNIKSFISEILTDIQLYPEQEKLLVEFYDNSNYDTLVAILGRRSGKTLLLSIMAAYECYKLIESDIIDRKTPLYVFLITTSLCQSEFITNFIWNLLSNSPYFADKSFKHGNDIWFNDKNGNKQFCLMTGCNDYDFLGKKCSAILYHEVENIESTIATIHPCLRSMLLNNYHVILVSGPGFENEYLYRSLYDEFKNKLSCHKATWEMNPNLTKNKLKSEFPHMSDVDFNVQFGAQFKKINVDVSQRINRRKKLLEELAVLDRFLNQNAYQCLNEIKVLDSYQKLIGTSPHKQSIKLPIEVDIDFSIEDILKANVSHLYSSLHDVKDIDFIVNYIYKITPSNLKLLSFTDFEYSSGQNEIYVQSSEVSKFSDESKVYVENIRNLYDSFVKDLINILSKYNLTLEDIKSELWTL